MKSSHCCLRSLLLSFFIVQARSCSPYPVEYSGNWLLAIWSTIDPNVVQARAQTMMACDGREPPRIVNITLSTGSVTVVPVASPDDDDVQTTGILPPQPTPSANPSKNFTVVWNGCGRSCNVSIFDKTGDQVTDFVIPNCSPPQEEINGWCRDSENYYSFWIGEVDGREYLFFLYDLPFGFCTDCTGTLVAVVDMNSMNVSFSSVATNGYPPDIMFGSWRRMLLYNDQRIAQFPTSLSCAQSVLLRYNETGVRVVYEWVHSYDLVLPFNDDPIFTESGTILVLHNEVNYSDTATCLGQRWVNGPEEDIRIERAKMKTISERSLETGELLRTYTLDEDSLARALTSDDFSTAQSATFSVGPSSNPSKSPSSIPSVAPSNSPSSLRFAAVLSASPSFIPPNNVGSSCFSGAMTVNVLGKGVVTMKDLQLGDKILVQDGKYEDIYSFGHKNDEATASFVELIVGETGSLELTENHMVLLEGGHAIPAAMVSAGDKLISAAGVPKTVESVRIVKRRGLYAPFTKSGTIIVNELLVSNYISYQRSEFLMISGQSTGLSYQWLAHSFNSIHRMAYYKLGIQEEGYSPNGLSHWVSIPNAIFSWTLQQQLLIQVAILVPSVALVTAASLLEFIALRSSRVEAFILLVLLVVVKARRQNIKC